MAKNSSEYSRQYYEKNKEKERERFRKRYWDNREQQLAYFKEYRARNKTEDGKLRKLLYTLKSRAKARGLDFDLEIEDLKNYPKVCPVLGIEIKLFADRNDPHCLSIDRFDNNKGYTKDNIRMISLRANFLKRDATVEELEKVCQYMKSP